MHVAKKVESLYKLIVSGLLLMSYRVGCWETCIKMQIEIYTSYIVYGLLLGGYGVTCIKILVRNLYKL